MKLAEEKKRKKVNFMINVTLLRDLVKCIPAGERSDFVNDALKESIVRYRRKKASAHIDVLRDRMKLRMTNAQIKKMTEYGRE